MVISSARARRAARRHTAARRTVTAAAHARPGRMPLGSDHPGGMRMLVDPATGQHVLVDSLTGNVITTGGDGDDLQPDRRSVAVRAARSYSWRWRRQLAPVAMMAGLWGCGAGLHAAPAGPLAVEVIVPLALILGTVFGWRWLRKVSAYVPVCLAVAAGTLVLLTTAGPLHAPAGAAVVAWTATALPWWWRNRHVASAAGEGDDNKDAGGGDGTDLGDGDGDPVDWDREPTAEEIWDEFVGSDGGPLPGSHLIGWHEVDDGWRAYVRLRRGRQAASQVTAAAEKIASAYGKSLDLVIVERHPTGAADMAMITVLDENPLSLVRYWTGPTLDVETGIIRIGPYAIGGQAQFRPWAPVGGGHAGGAINSLICGAQGSGKSQFLLQLALEYMLSGVIVTWAADPQMGQSMPELIDYVDWTALGIPETMEMLRAARLVLYARSQEMARRKERAYTWTRDFPMLRIIIDEAHRVLKDPVYGKEAVAICEELTQMGRKVGIGLDLVTQVPELPELGKSEVLRSMLTSGNIVVFRTSGTMTGQLAFQGGSFPVRPDLIPKTFPDGSGTAGLCYLMSASACESVARTLYVRNAEAEIAAAADIQAALDQLSRRAAGAVYERRRGGDGSSADGIVEQVLTSVPPLPATVFMSDTSALPVPGRPDPVAERDDEGESAAWKAAGRTAVDVVLTTLQRAGRPLKVGEVVLAAEQVAVEWGRSEPYKIRSISGALTSLKTSGKVGQDGEKSPYYLTAPAAAPAPATSAPTTSPDGTAATLAAMELLVTAANLVTRTGVASAGFLCQRLGCRRDVADALMAALEASEVIGPDTGAEFREVLTDAGGAEAALSSARADEAMQDMVDRHTSA